MYTFINYYFKLQHCIFYKNSMLLYDAQPYTGMKSLGFILASIVTFDN